MRGLRGRTGFGTRGRYSPLGGAGAPAAPFPTLTDLRGRYRGDLGITLVGFDVQTWADQSAVGPTNDMSAAAVGNRPLWVASGFNGGAQPYVEFDGALEYLRNAAFSWGGVQKPYTLSFVLQVTAPVNGDAVFQYGAGAPYILIDASGVPTYTGTAGPVTVGTTALTTAKMLTVAWGADNVQRVYIGGTQEDSDANASAGIADGGILSLAAGTAGGATVAARYAEVIAMRAAITAGELADLYAYASARYGV